MSASIWLRPSEPEANRLRGVIADLAEAHGTIAFAPHLTVCGVPDRAALEAAAAYVAECGLLPLETTKTAVTGAAITPFRAVFIEVEDTPLLRRFREALRAICGAPPFDPPHISLLYTIDRQTQQPRPDLDAARLAAIARDCAARIAETGFTLSRPVAVGRTGAASWQPIREI
jgi:hypothetical protein